MSEKNKALVGRLYEEVLNQKKIHVIDELYADSFIYHNAGGFPREIRGRKDFKRLVEAGASAFPDLHCTVEDIVAERDRVAVRWAFRGTHKGRFMGIQPTGKLVTYTSTSTCRIQGGKIVETFENADQLGFLQQLGVVPSLGY